MSAPRWTPGPWRWEVNLKGHDVKLCGGARPKFDLTVMSFARWGMGGAAPRFIDQRNVMHRCDTMAAIVPGREHHADWFRTINHPDARLIAAAPDLAEACQPLAAIDIDHMADLPDDDRVVYLKNGIRLGDIRAARAALSKARGETP